MVPRFTLLLIAAASATAAAIVAETVAAASPAPLAAATPAATVALWPIPAILPRPMSVLGAVAGRIAAAGITAIGRGITAGRLIARSPIAAFAGICRRVPRRWGGFRIVVPRRLSGLGALAVRIGFGEGVRCVLATRARTTPTTGRTTTFSHSGG